MLRPIQTAQRLGYLDLRQRCAASQATGHILIGTMMALRANRGLEEDCPDQFIFRDLCASGMRAETQNLAREWKPK
jgi:hypothetical protein